MVRKPDRVRKPAVAGMFYSSDPAQLQHEIDTMLMRVPAPESESRPLVLIEPHAGYQYSGQVAAYGYSLLRGRDVRTVVVISPSHMEAFPYVSVFTGDAYETPLGVVPVDRDVCDELAASNRLIRPDDSGHFQEHLSRQEHALEVQIPFLQQVLDDFALVPLVMGRQDWDTCQALGDALGPILARPGVVVVASTDLSHFHTYDEAKKLDSRFCSLLEEMAPDKLYEAVGESSCEACGAGPVIASLIAARHAGGRSCRVLHTANSGDVTGDRMSVVGYACAVVTDGGASRERADQAGEFELSAEDKSTLLLLARHSVEAAAGMTPTGPQPPTTPLLAEKCGAFVTLKIADRLRGCIGYIEPVKSLYDTVREVATAAARQDPRFEPLAAEDVPKLTIEISVLSPLRPIQRVEQVEVGKHGLVVEQGARRGLLLPQVARERGWNAVEFAQHTCEKAGMPPEAWKRDDVRWYVFTSAVFESDYASIH